MRFFYSLALSFYQLAIYLAAPFNQKAALWIAGRKHWKKQLEEAIKGLGEGERIWIHVASLGEFEQGRPLIESIRQRYPQYKIILSFFSPSGYELRKNYPLVDYVCYLPLDTASNASFFVRAINPKFVFFVKYEFWHFYLQEAKKLGIPVYLISANFRASQIFFKAWAGFFRQLLYCFEHIFVQNEASKKLLEAQGLQNITVSGDTRIDRVLAIKAQAQFYPIVGVFKGDAPLMVLGSSWPADHQLLDSFFLKYLLKKDWKLLVAPHEISKENISKLRNDYQKRSISCILYSQSLETSMDELANFSVLIIDNIGMLSSLYTYATVAYIGGGFGAGIHNVLEPAAFEIPILFGPKHKKFAEAIDLINLGVAFSVQNETELRAVFNQLKPQEISLKASQYLTQQQGATNRILEKIDL